MQVRPGRPSGGTGQGDDIPGVHSLSHLHQQLGVVGIKCGKTAAVVDHDVVAIAGAVLGDGHRVGSRIYEAIEEAGGFTQEAADDYLNLAYRLEDGWKIEIPERKGSGEESGEAEKDGEDAAYKAVVVSGIAPDTGVRAGAVTGTEAGTAGETDGGLVDINTAAKEELLTLPGVGESRAQSIISYREKNGGFSRIEDIMRVEGIKEGMFAKMKDKICVRGVQ